MSVELRTAAREIFLSALRSVDVIDAVQSRIRIGDGTLILADHTLPRADFDSIILIAMGKAAVPMHAAARAALDGIPVRALVIGPTETHPGNAPAYFLSGVHPTPGVESLAAAEAIFELLQHVDERTVVLFLISGGASAMVEQPLDPTITLDDLAAFHRALVGSGLVITEMNTLRKHMSAVKGGRLAVAAAAAYAQCTLLISDVPAADPDAIGSGPSLPDTTTVDDCEALFQHLRTTAVLPASILNFFANLPETPKPGDPAFERSYSEVILSSEHLGEAAFRAAEAAGFHAEIDNTCDEWDYRDAAEYLLDRSAALSLQYPRSCLISVGEVSVTLSADAGEGGRNQQMALWCAQELVVRGSSASILCAGSDGIDGRSNAAGAVCDETTFERVIRKGYSVADGLAGFHTSPLLRAVGDSIVTGPTSNNLRDLRLILTDRDL